GETVKPIRKMLPCVLRGSLRSHRRMRSVVDRASNAGGAMYFIGTTLEPTGLRERCTTILILRCDPELVEGEPRRTHQQIAQHLLRPGVGRIVDVEQPCGIDPRIDLRRRQAG